MDASETYSKLVRSARRAATDIADVGEPGFYAWWDEQGALGRFWPKGLPEVDVSRPLYVGIAKKSLASRVPIMHLESTRMSTVRRSLVALLHTELRLDGAVEARGKGKFAVDPSQEPVLTSWMLTHLRLSWVTHPRPATIERDVIGQADPPPPLNYIYATHGPYANKLRALRAVYYATLPAAGRPSSPGRDSRVR